MARTGSGSVYKIKQRQKDNAKKLGVRIEVANDKTKKIDVFEGKPKPISEEKLKKMSKEKQEEYKRKRDKPRLLASIGGMYDDGTPYGDYATYLKNPVMPKSNKKIDPEKQRRLYLARHSLEPKEYYDEFFKKKMPTPSYWADVILWK